MADLKVSFALVGDVRKDDSFEPYNQTRLEMTWLELSETSGKTSGKILEAIRNHSDVTIPELSLLTGVTERSIERNIQNLQAHGRLLRIGPAKGGHWEVLDE